MNNNIYIDGVSLERYGVVPTGSGLYTSPEKDLEVIHVPGRNGDIVIDSGAYSNVTVTYPCYISSNFRRNYNLLKNFLLSKKGYFTIKDTYEPDFIRHGFLGASIEPELTNDYSGANFELVFNCKPQRYHVDTYDLFYQIRSSTFIYAAGNRTAYPSMPIYRFEALQPGTLTVLINNRASMTITATDAATVDVDAETLICTASDPDKIDVGFSPYSDLRLMPGVNPIVILGDSTAINMSFASRLFSL